MDARIKEELIRRGDAAFEDEDFHRAREFYTKADHKEGLIRIGDFYMYEKRLPLMAYGYYKKAGAQIKIDDLHRRMVGAFAQWIGPDKLKDDSLEEVYAPEQMTPDKDGMIRVPVAGELLKEARKILEKQK
ncbi:MAG TPA: hypothetical protein DEA96_10995 [Leptospiraceae bacterium]|nr:hypothetical protein [Spirochaetaceae bacterium]HBS05485.1 hypothetical protein [Leptospiraceae bacterium]|tara:strand:+ start:24939 stop:25331 length:393 start_codon:yes stop_codon:yes gene_type:complete